MMRPTMITRTGRFGKAPRTILARRIGTGAAAALFSTLALRAQSPSSWPQWGRTSQHGGASPAVAQPLDVVLADVVYDPFVEQMKAADEDGELLAHYAVPLVDASGVYMAVKSGTFTTFGDWSGITWNVTKLEWIGGILQPVWTFASDWKPPGLTLTQWEPVFLPAMTDTDVYVPGFGGTVHRVSKETGAEVERLNPFPNVDPSRYVAGGLALAPDGSVVYDAVGLDASDPLGPITGAWLARVAAGGHADSVAFSTLVPGAPAAGDACQSSFSSDQAPLPPSTTAVPPTIPCGDQRPGINVVPAIAADGTIYTLTRAHNADRYAYLVAARADLTPLWAASFRNLLNDGCGVVLRDDDSQLGCRSGANAGVDPDTNDRPSGRIADAGTSSPAVLPDGSIAVGVFTSYNFFRGHLMKFSATGGLLGAYDFGWDITPAIYTHDGTYSVLIKDNHYETSDGTAFYDITSLDADFVPEWSYRATNTESCVRGGSGAVTCVSDHPEGFEWCVNQPAVDAAGTVFANSEDGALYAFDPTGAIVEHFFLDTALGAAYTPVAIGPNGIVYTQNNGHLFAVGKRAAPREHPALDPSAPAPPRVVERP
jgi:outer membrane protein assembly factor BamB